MVVAPALDMFTESNKTLVRFSNARDVRRALEAIRRRHLLRPRISVSVQTERIGHEELPIKFTHASGGFRQGAMFGAFAGLVAGIVVAMSDAATTGSGVSFAIGFSLAGMLMGGLAGVLVGSMNPIPEIEALEKSGGIVLILESRQPDDIRWVKALLQRCGGELLSPPSSANGQPKSGAAISRPSPA